jgi:hypothetical protein
MPFVLCFTRTKRQEKKAKKGRDKQKRHHQKKSTLFMENYFA